MVYVGWTADGVMTRNGFFNSGEWNYLTMRDALKGLRKYLAQAKAMIATSEYFRGTPVHKGVDCADLQVFVPRQTKIK